MAEISLARVRCSVVIVALLLVLYFIIGSPNVAGENYTKWRKMLAKGMALCSEKKRRARDSSLHSKLGNKKG